MNDVGGVVSEVFRDFLMSFLLCRVSGSILESIVVNQNGCMYYCN